jgi:hypothetical protein
MSSTFVRIVEIVIRKCLQLCLPCRQTTWQPSWFSDFNTARLAGEFSTGEYQQDGGRILQDGGQSFHRYDNKRTRWLYRYNNMVGRWRAGLPQLSAFDIKITWQLAWTGLIKWRPGFPPMIDNNRQDGGRLDKGRVAKVCIWLVLITRKFYLWKTEIVLSTASNSVIFCTYISSFSSKRMQELIKRVASLGCIVLHKQLSFSHAATVERYLRETIYVYRIVPIV